MTLLNALLDFDYGFYMDRISLAVSPFMEMPKLNPGISLGIFLDGYKSSDLPCFVAGDFNEI